MDCSDIFIVWRNGKVDLYVIFVLLKCCGVFFFCYIRNSKEFVFVDIVYRSWIIIVNN